MKPTVLTCPSNAFRWPMTSRGLVAALMLFLVSLPSLAVERIRYIHTDALGSPVAASKPDGNVAWRETYDPYGERTTQDSASQTNSRWYTGHPEDPETGFVYAGARYYDPAMGRFMAVDPASFTENNLQSFNRYAYGNNNPYKYVDPDGRETAQIGGNVSAKLWGPLAITFTWGVAIDTHGNIAIYGEDGPVTTTSPDASVGLVVHVSNGETIDDLKGKFVNVNLGGGWGEHMQGDGFFGYGSHDQRVIGGGFTIGLGAGAASSVSITDTVIPDTTRLNIKDWIKNLLPGE